jgi:hypothetical protein
MNSQKNQSGFSLILTLVIMLALLAAVSVIVTMMVNESEEIDGRENKILASRIGHYGIEQATLDLKNDTDWTNNGGSQTRSYLGGSYTITQTVINTYNIHVVSKGTYNDTNQLIQRNITNTQKLANKVNITTANASLITNGKTLTNIDLSNNDVSDISITKMVISWAPSSSTDNVEQIKIGNQTMWVHDGVGSPDGTQPSSTQFIFDTPYNLTAGAINKAVKIYFATSMIGKQMALYFVFSDNSVLYADAMYSGGTEADNLNIDVSAGTTSGPGDDKVTGITLTNLNTINTITADKIKVSWSYNSPSAVITDVDFKNTAVWGTGSEPSGTTLNLTGSGRSLASEETKELKLYFDIDIQFRYFSFTVEMSDGSQKSAELDLRIDQSSYLTVTTSNAKIAGTKLESLELNNSHANANIWIKNIIVEVTPDDSQTVDSIDVSGTEIFSTIDEPDDLAVTLNSDVTTINTSAMTHFIDFSYLPSSATFDLTYIMTDDTQKQLTFPASQQEPMAGQLTVSTSNSVVNSQLKEITGTTLTNESASAITINKFKPTWTPNNDGIKIKSLIYNGTTHWNLNAGEVSGTDITLDTPITMTGGQANILLTYVFTGASIAGNDLNVVFTFSDTTTKTIDYYFNPANPMWMAVENYESGDGSGGNGFVGNWNTNGSIQSQTSPYSGANHIRLKKNNEYAARQINVPATANAMAISFRAKLSGFDPGDTALFMISGDNKSSWDTLHTWATEADGAYLQYIFDLTPTMSTQYFIRFESNMSANNESIFIDEIYVY